MSQLSELTGEIAVRFHLGPKAGTVVGEILDLIAAQPAGIDGFLGKIRTAGLEEKVASWLGGPYPMALSGHEVRKALGVGIITRTAEKTGLAEGTASKALGYAIPKLIGVLAADCPVPEAAPARFGFSGSASPSAVPRFETFTFWRKQMPRSGTGDGRFGLAPSLVVPAVAVLVTLGLFWHSLTEGTAGDRSVFHPAPIMGFDAPLAPQESASTDDAHAAAPGGPVKTAFGAEKTNANFAVKAGWIQNLNAVVKRSSRQASQVPFADNGFNVGTIYASQAWLIASIPSARLPQFAAAVETGSGAAKIKRVASFSGGETAGLQNQVALDFPPVLFPYKNTEVQADCLTLLRSVAEQIKRLPPGTLVQLKGYADSKGTPASNTRLSRQRAESVYRILIAEGVNPAMLRARGYGSGMFVASGGNMAEGRSTTGGKQSDAQQERRVEIHVIPQRP